MISSKLAFTTLVFTTILFQVSGRPFGNQIDDSESNSLETILKNYGDKLRQIDVGLLLSGKKKYDSLSRGQQVQLSSGKTPEEQQHLFDDTFEVNDVLDKDPEAKQLWDDYTNKKYEVGSEDELRIIKKLDAKFANTPAWGRFWKRITDELAEFYEKYG